MASEIRIPPSTGTSTDVHGSALPQRRRAPKGKRLVIVPPPRRDAASPGSDAASSETRHIDIVI